MVRLILPWVFIVGLFCSPAIGQDGKVKDGKKSPSAGSIDIKSLSPGPVYGKVTSPPNDKSLVIQIPFKTPANNAGGNGQNPRGGMRKGNPAQGLVTRWKDLEVPVTPLTKYRFFEPPQAFDEKGNIIRYSTEELKKIKGDPKLPGFEGKPENVKSGDLVEVRLNRVKGEEGKETRLAATLVLVKGTYNLPGNMPMGKKKK
ncbi:MAG: hypothetical protein EXR99_00295 [Gemmataceae bacterium]|nr:hypothetical protein [Gemmataceae bacterium]